MASSSSSKSKRKLDSEQPEDNIGDLKPDLESKRKFQKLESEGSDDAWSKEPCGEHDSVAAGSERERLAALRALASKMLNIGPVLDKIAANLTITELLDLRGRCKSWNESFTTEVGRKHSPLRFNLGPYGKAEKMIKYTDFMRQRLEEESSLTVRLPFTKYEICNPLTKLQQFKEFMASCGSQMTSLIVVTGGVDIPSQDLYELKRAIFESTAGLTELALDLKGAWIRSPSVCVPRDIPKLKRLRVNTCNAEDCLEFFRQLIQTAIGLEALLAQDLQACSVAIPALRDLALSLNNLTTLEMFMPSQEDLKILVELAKRTQKPLGLKKLAVTMDCTYGHSDFGGPAERLLYAFLVTQQKSLEELTIGQGGLGTSARSAREGKRVRPILLPKMTGVLALGLARRELGWMEWIRFDGGTLANTFPALKKLVIDNHFREWNLCYGNFNYETMLHNGVQDLTLKVEMVGCNLTRMAVLFPAVIKCDVGLSACCCDFKFVEPPHHRTIWTVWPGLQDLRLELMDLFLEGAEGSAIQMDEYLTGVPCWPDAVYGAYTHNDTKLLLNTEQRRTVLEKFKTEPGIADLKQLKRLTICAGHNYRCFLCMHGVTNIGGVFGLAMAGPALKHIALDRCFTFHARDRHGLSKECVDEIKTALGQLGTFEWIRSKQ